jgi:hypothetical protein
MKRGLHFTALVLFCILSTISCKNDDEQEEAGLYCLLDIYQERSISIVYEYDANDRLYRVDYLDTLGLSTGHYTSFLDLDEDGRTDKIEKYYEDTLFLFSEITYEDNVRGGEIAKGKWEYTDESEDVEYKYEFDERGRIVKYTRKEFDPGPELEIIRYTDYTWENDNVVSISAYPNYGRWTATFFKYDNGKNPYYHFDNAWVISQDYSHETRSKNNPIKVTKDGDFVNTISYTYDHNNYPISAIRKIGNVEYSYTRCGSFIPD